MEKISNSCNSKNSNNNLIVIIGNRFGKFADTHAWAITFSQFEKELEAFSIAPENHTSFIYGQGLHDDQLHRIENWLSKNNRLSAKFPKRACRWLTHKHEAKNILISDFFKLSENVFRADLLIDDRNELLTDHVSGHISGMTEIEAIRQSFLAVTEQFYIPKGDSSSQVFVTLSKKVEFKKFFFPLPAYVEFNMTEANVSPSGKHRFKAHVTLHQANQIFGEAYVEYCILLKTQLSNKEVDQANSITHFFVNKPGAKHETYNELINNPTILLDGELDVFGDGLVIIYRVGGHTMGSQILQVKLKSKTIILGGDIYHFKEQRTYKRVPKFNYDSIETVKAMDFIETLLEKTPNSELWITHDPEQMEQLIYSPKYYK